MVDKFLKIAGVKSEKEFYDKYPTEEAFMKVHGAAFQKAINGTTTDTLMYGLSGLDALVPGERIANQYVRPEQSVGFNPNAMGTGSQAIMDSGGSLSDTTLLRKPLADTTGFSKWTKEARSNWFRQRDLEAINKGIKGPSKAALDSAAKMLNKPMRENFLNEIGYQTVVKQLDNGGKMSNDGNTILANGSIEQLSDNPFDGGTQIFHGPSHEQGGIKINHNGTPVEVEGEETKIRNTIMGNMNVPGTSEKFKSVAKRISKEENKISNIKTKAAKIADEAHPTDKYSLNTAKVMLEGSTLKQQDLAKQKDWLVNLQENMLAVAEENGLDPQEMSKGKIAKAKHGLSIADNGKKIPKGVNMDDLYMNKIFSDELKRIGGKNAMDGKWGPNHQKAYNYALSKGVVFDPATRETNAISTPEKRINYDTGAFVNFQNLTGSNNYNWETQNSVFEENPNSITPIPYQTYKKPSFDFTGVGKVVGKDMLFGMNQPKEKAPITGVPQDDIVVNQQRLPYTQEQPLSFMDFAPELVALGQNKVQPVKAQHFTPELMQNYNISLQAARNRVNAAQRAAQSMMGYNPAAAASIAAGTQEQLADINEKEFQANQANKASIINSNIQTLNDARLKNLGIDDQQYTRQEEAKSKTRAQGNEILKSITSKVLQNKADYKKLNVYENLYGHRFDPVTGEATWQGGKANMTGLSAYPDNKVVTQVVKDGKNTTTTKTSPKKIGSNGISIIRLAKK